MTGIDALVGGLVIAVIAQALVMWRTQGVIENDIKHLTAAVETMQADIKELSRRA